MPPIDPDEVEFRVGGMALTPGSASAVLITFIPVEDEESDPVTFEASFEQLDGMAQAALTAVASGRPLCSRCNLPIDPDGHTCPSSNGDLRNQRS